MDEQKHDPRIKPEDRTKCETCGREVSRRWNFCPKCGKEKLARLERYPEDAVIEQRRMRFYADYFKTAQKEGGDSQ